MTTKTKTKPNIQQVMSEVASKMRSASVDWARLEVRENFSKRGIVYVSARVETGLRSMEPRINISMHVGQHGFIDAADAVAFAAEITAAAALVLELEGIVRDHRWGYDELESLIERISGKKLEHAPGEN